METVLLLIFMLIGYGVAFFFIMRALIIGLSLKKGQVPYVPVDRALLVEGINALNLKSGDKFIDIGSGDGRVLFYVAKRFPNIQCVGVEINRWLVYWSQFRAFISGFRNVKFIRGDALNVELYDLPSFNRVFLYLTLDLVELLNPLLITNLKKGSMVVSCKFGFGEAGKAGQSSKAKISNLGLNGSQFLEIR